MKALSILFCCLSSLMLTGQGKYGLNPTNFVQYKTSLKTDPDKELVDLEKVIPGVVLDIRYATKNNLTGEKVYQLAKAYARKPVAKTLLKAQADFNKLGYGIKIFDGYRPYSATVKFYETMNGDTTYVASPYKGSRHNRGCAIDMTIIDLKSKKDLPMPSDYDAPVKESWPSTPVDDPIVRKNRDTLIAVMEKNGFKVYTTEWWHFDFVGWEKFEVMNIDFEELRK